ncbi:MAG: hypothetical protein FJ398_13040 [Verrucomicrobia bacterium]|nr:hypothetical protein [Verrucomicrobiota bacterium]
MVINRNTNLQVALEHRGKVEEFQRKHRIGLLTLLFTDLIGSTKLKQDLGDREAVAIIQRHRALVQEIFSRFHEGEEISTAGDSFLDARKTPPASPGPPALKMDPELTKRYGL